MSTISINPTQNFMSTSTFSSRGRITRQRFLATFLILMILSWLVFFGLLFALIGANTTMTEDEITGIALLASGVFYIPLLFAYIKRCRDCGLSPHWTWLILVPLANLILFFYLLFKGSIPLPENE